MSADSEYCQTCGQKLPQAREGYGNWDRKPESKRIGIGISIALHLIGVLYYLFKPHEPVQHMTAAAGGQMVYIAPLPDKKPKQQQKKTEVAKASKPPPPRKAVQTITPPAAERPKLETFVPPVVAKMQPPPEVDLSEMIAKRRAARQADNPQPAEPAQESENDKRMRIAKANIMGAQGRSGSGEREQKGGLIEIVNKSYHSADIKFRHYNSNFKREWLQEVHVDQGAEADIESAVVRRMMELIRKDWPDEVPYHSDRLGRVIVVNTRRENDAGMFAFLLKELFPEYHR